MDQKQHGLGRISSNSGKNLESPGCFQRSCVEWVPLSTARQTFVFLLSFGYFLRLLTIPLRSLRKRFITSQPHCLIFCNTSLRLGLGFNPKQDGDGTPAQQQQFAENLRMLIARRAKAPVGNSLERPYLDS